GRPGEAAQGGIFLQGTEVRRGGADLRRTARVPSIAEAARGGCLQTRLVLRAIEGRHADHRCVWLFRESFSGEPADAVCADATRAGLPRGQDVRPRDRGLEYVAREIPGRAGARSCAPAEGADPRPAGQCDGNVGRVPAVAEGIPE